MIVVVTPTTELRHERLALRAHAELGKCIWLVTESKPMSMPVPESKGDSLAGRIAAEWRRTGIAGVVARAPRAARHLRSKVGRRRADLLRHRRGASAEHALFASEVEDLRAKFEMTPARIQNTELNARLAGAKLVLAMDASPIAARPILCANGNDVAAWALYHRRLDQFCATVLDGDGGIVRWSLPALAATDTLETCLLRISALSTELLVDAARRWLADGRLYNDPPLWAAAAAVALPSHLYLDIERDFASGWLGRELKRARSF
jgi:hypothetical protein